jgi:AmmeMemoRadiSam system protein A
LKIRQLDSEALWLSKQFQEGLACGINPLISFLEFVKTMGGQIRILEYANSGDTYGDIGRGVVGYLSAVAYVDNGGGMMTEYSLNKEEKKQLLTIARETLTNHLQGKPVPEFAVDSDNLIARRGAFVTLKKQGHLRGCIGRIVADTDLYRVISDFAINAAVHDPRFRPVGYEELQDIEIEISVLTPFERISSLDEIEVGKHGLMLKKGFSSGLLLPQVPLEYGWDRDTFLEHLCVKAGLAPNSYKDKNVVIEKFSAIVFSEGGLK